MDTISRFTLMHAFFDAFDEAVAIPNEGHIKYEVGSDGLVVIIVDDTKLKDSVVKFVEEYDLKLKEKEEKEERREEEELQSKKKKSKSNA